MIYQLLLLFVLFIAAARDMARREIPHVLVFAVLALGVTAQMAGWSDVSWTECVAGLLLGLVVCVPLFAVGALGGGDVKLIAACGFVLGWRSELSFFLYTAVCGGVMAFVARRAGWSEFPYGPAIAGGFAVHLALGWLRAGAV